MSIELPKPSPNAVRRVNRVMKNMLRLGYVTRRHFRECGRLMHLNVPTTIFVGFIPHDWLVKAHAYIAEARARRRSPDYVAKRLFRQHLGGMRSKYAPGCGAR